MNECTNGADWCHDDATCNNTEGSYTCTCNPGYNGNGFCCISKLYLLIISQMQQTQHVVFIFLDINECLINNGGCQHHCHDSDGSYTCSCSNGYQLNSDGHTCDGKFLITTAPKSDTNCINTEQNINDCIQDISQR